MGFLLTSSVVGGVALAALLLLAHLLLWDRLSRVSAYAVGVGLGWVVFAPLALLNGFAGAALAYLVMYCIGGAAVAGAYHVRQRLADVDRAAFNAGQVAGPMPRGGSLTQEQIDQGLEAGYGKAD